MDGLTVRTKAGPVWTGEVRFNEHQLRLPLTWGGPRKVFVCANSDLFNADVPDEWIDRIFAVMACASGHVFKVLTKRAKRMRGYMTDSSRYEKIQAAAQSLGLGACGTWPFPNVWMGVTIENQESSDERIPFLLDTPAAIRWASAEPMLEPIRLSKQAVNGLDWVSAGGEIGVNARPTDPDWLTDLRGQCDDADVSFMFQQWGSACPKLEQNPQLRAMYAAVVGA